MVRINDRSLVVGLGGLALVVAGFSLMSSKHGGHASTDAGSWSSLQRGSVVTGSVRGEETKPVTTPPAASVVDMASSADAPSADVPPLQSKETAAPAKRETRLHAKRHGVERTVTAHATNHRHSANSVQEAVPAVTAATAPVEAAPSIPTTPPPPRVVDEARDAAPPPPKPAQIEQPKSADAAPVVAASSGPKTRKQVQDELRHARQDGALPRFGNPDPAGPGGVPGTRGEEE